MITAGSSAGPNGGHEIDSSKADITDRKGDNELASSRPAGMLDDSLLSTPDIQSPNFNPAKPQATSSKKYMRPNPKLKPTAKSASVDKSGTGFKMVSAGGDDEDEDSDNNNNINNTSNFSSPHGKRLGSPKEKLLIIQEMMGSERK